jgi:hypothetical protein
VPKHMPIFVHYEVFTVATRTRTRGSVFLLCGSKCRDKSLMVLAKSEGGGGGMEVGGESGGGGGTWQRQLLCSI